MAAASSDVPICPCCQRKMEPGQNNASPCCSGDLCAERCQPAFKCMGHCPYTNCFREDMQRSLEPVALGVDKCECCFRNLTAKDGSPRLAVCCKKCRAPTCVTCYRHIMNTAENPICPVCKLEDWSHAGYPRLSSDQLTIADPDSESDVFMSIEQLLSSGWTLICPNDRLRLVAKTDSGRLGNRYTCLGCSNSWYACDLREMNPETFLEKSTPYTNFRQCIEFQGARFTLRAGTDYKRLANTIHNMLTLACPCCQRQLECQPRPDDPADVQFVCGQCQRRYECGEVVNQYLCECTAEYAAERTIVDTVQRFVPMLLECKNPRCEGGRLRKKSESMVEYEFKCPTCRAETHMSQLVDWYLVCDRAPKLACPSCTDRPTTLVLGIDRVYHCPTCVFEVTYSEVKRQVADKLRDPDAGDPNEPLHFIPKAGKKVLSFSPAQGDTV